jgi:hypothetical protein
MNGSPGENIVKENIAGSPRKEAALSLCHQIRKKTPIAAPLKSI